MIGDLAVFEIEFPADIIRVDGKEHSKLWADGGQAHARERRAVRLEIEGVRRGSDLEERGIGQRATEFVNLAGDSAELEPEGFVLDVANRGVVGFVVHNENALLGELRNADAPTEDTRYSYAASRVWRVLLSELPTGPVGPYFSMIISLVIITVSAPSVSFELVP